MWSMLPVGGGLVQLLPGASASLVLGLVALVVLVAVFNARRSRMVKLIGKIPGPPALPLLGNTIELNVAHDEVFERLTATVKMWGQTKGVTHAWMGTTPYVLLSKPDVVEPILGSMSHVGKSQDYYYLQPWLGTGLLTSSGRKWHSRRKALTPAFHFKILDDFLDVFNEQAEVLVDKLAGELGGSAFNLFQYVTLCTLDIVCETAMGRQVNAQQDSDSDYVKAVYEIGSIVQSRQAKVWLQPDALFHMTKLYSKHQQCIKTLHDFSNKVIRERKEEVRVRRDSDLEVTEFDAGKKRLAFLDLLIEASQNGALLSDEDIREEVDTFMFEGHDTTSAGICWTLFLLGSHPEIQERVHGELERIFDGTERRATMKDLHNMRYLECCIKEALRLYPSVPMMARTLKEDVKVADYTVPAGTTAMIMTYMLHRDAQTFPEPEKFIPERFLPENAVGRHPYAYIPFSAGPRNCIGQKFAMLEEKTVISSVISRYHVTAAERREELTLLGELILRPKHGLNVTVTAR